MASKTFVQSWMAVWFRGAKFQGAEMCRRNEMGAIEKCLSPLSDKLRWR